MNVHKTYINRKYNLDVSTIGLGLLQYDIDIKKLSISLYSNH